jgi:xylulokinase
MASVGFRHDGADTGACDDGPRCPGLVTRSAAAAYLGVDLGTSGLKLALLGAEGGVLAEAEAGYDVLVPGPGRAEADPVDWVEAWLTAADTVACRAEAAMVAAIGLSGQMHGVVVTGPDGHALRPAILWPDTRAGDVLGDWVALHPEARERLANPLVAGMAGPILGWLRAHEPESVPRSGTVLSPKDWLRRQLTGVTATERSDASATLLWDVPGDRWSVPALRLAGIGPDQLPRLVGSAQVAGSTSWPPQSSASAPTAPTEVPVVAGGADTACALTGLRAALPADDWSETIVVNVGTGIQVIRPDVQPAPRLDPVSHLYADTDNGWYEMLAVKNGGSALSWVQEVLQYSWRDFVAAASGAEPGARGALFTPFLTGERGGIGAAESTAAWSRLTTSTRRPELARAAFESLAFTIRRGIELLDGEDLQVVLSGGGAREPWVRRLVADALGTPVRYVALRSASAVGAAVLAARGLGVEVRVRSEVETVNPTGVPVLEQAYERWLELT